MPQLQTPLDILDRLAAIARQAGEVIMAIYATDFTVRGKTDASPVTAADEQAEAVILAGLRGLAPEIAVVAEEEAAAGRSPAVGDRPGDRFWLVDPLDGTREFVDRNGEFTVNIALVEGGQVLAGVVLAPALPGASLYAGWVGHGAWIEDRSGRRGIHCRAVPAEGLTVLASRSHGDAAALDRFLADRPVARRLYAGSSLKLCRLAAGEGDLYPRLGRTMEWDIAAGHAVLAAAGGQVCDLSGRPLRYGKPGFENPHFVASGLPAAPTGSAGRR